MAREGCKLLVRNSKGGGQEEYLVDSIEVVSFGHSLFFRSQERPKSFLVPVSDYEVLELKEARMTLKNVTPDRSIKIGGGRDIPPPRPPREPAPEADSYEQPPERVTPERPPMDRDRSRGKRRRGRRGSGRSDGPPMHERGPQPPAEGPFPYEAPQGTAPSETGEPVKAPSFISKLFPPPPTLIKDTISRYKTAETTEEVTFQKEEKVDDILFDTPRPKDDNVPNSEEEPFEE
jgi:hypothetical protein